MRTRDVHAEVVIDGLDTPPSTKSKEDGGFACGCIALVIVAILFSVIVKDLFFSGPSKEVRDLQRRVERLESDIQWLKMRDRTRTPE